MWRRSQFVALIVVDVEPLCQLAQRCWLRGRGCVRSLLDQPLQRLVDRLQAGANAVDRVSRYPGPPVHQTAPVQGRVTSLGLTTTVQVGDGDVVLLWQPLLGVAEGSEVPEGPPLLARDQG